MNLGILAACTAMVMATEAGAYIFKVWTYRSAWLRLANVVANSVVLGLVSTQSADVPVLIRFFFGAALGTVHEAANLYVFRFWTFKNERLLFLHSRPAIVLGAGLPWGLLPVLACPVGAYLGL